ncbi:MAG: S41 family peptidase [Candidatus Bathyarchaeota archaeon]|nr:S41 family peptidase [Candidatus Bathyarchaeota archaeon]
MRKRSLAILSLLAITAAAFGVYSFLDAPRHENEFSPVDQEDLGVKEWLEDFECLYDFIEANYPYIELKERTHDYNWLDLRGLFEERIKNATDNEEFLQVIMEAVEALQNRHTQVVEPDEVVEYHARFNESPVMSAVFSDEVSEAAEYWSGIYDAIVDRKYLTSFEVRIVYDRGDYILTDYFGGPEGSKATKVDGVPIDDAVQACFDRDYLDWDFVREKLYLWRVAPDDFGGDAVFTIMDSDGEEADVTFHTTRSHTSFSHLYPRSTLVFERYEEAGVGYMYVRTFQPSALEHRYDEILDFLREIKGYGHLIIDIRGNTGGSFSTWVNGIVRPLLREGALHEYYLAYKTGEYVQWFHDEYLREKAPVTKEVFDYLLPEVYGEDYVIYNFSGTYTPTHEVDFDGEIILLTDFMVYSAAEGFTNFCKQTGFATIYGTPSGGDGFFVWPLYCALPNSKIAITMTSSMSLDRTGHANEEVRTRPDVYHESPFMDHDELIDFVLEEISKG